MSEDLPSQVKPKILLVDGVSDFYLLRMGVDRPEFSVYETTFKGGIFGARSRLSTESSLIGYIHPTVLQTDGDPELIAVPHPMDISDLVQQQYGSMRPRANSFFTLYTVARESDDRFTDYVVQFFGLPKSEIIPR